MHLGREQRDGIDLYYANVQLLSERDLQRLGTVFTWILGKTVSNTFLFSSLLWRNDPQFDLRIFFRWVGSTTNQKFSGIFSLDLLQITSI